MPTLLDRSLAHGKVVEKHDGMIVLQVLGTDYLLHLVADEVKSIPLNRRVAGRIEARARRVDVVRTGGRYVEPGYGRPRRLQGRIFEIDRDANTISVLCGPPFICHLTDPRQRAERFEEGQLVSFDVERGSRFMRVQCESQLIESETSDALESETGSPQPPGHLPTEGSQLPTEERTPSKTRDQGALTDTRDISGQDKPAADFPISG